MNVNGILKRSVFYITIKQNDKSWSLCVQSLNSLCSFYWDTIKIFILYLLNICMLRILFVKNLSFASVLHIILLFTLIMAHVVNS